MVYDISVFYRLGPGEHREGEHYSRTTVHSNFCIHIGHDVYAVSSVLNATGYLKYTLYGPDRLFAHAHKHATHTYE